MCIKKVKKWINLYFILNIIILLDYRIQLLYFKITVEMERHAFYQPNRTQGLEKILR